MEVTPETARDAARLTGLATLFILARVCLRARVLPSKCPRAREVRSKDEFGAVGTRERLDRVGGYVLESRLPARPSHVAGLHQAQSGSIRLNRAPSGSIMPRLPHTHVLLAPRQPVRRHAISTLLPIVRVPALDDAA